MWLKMNGDMGSLLTTINHLGEATKESENLPLIAAVGVGLLTFVILFRPFFGEKKDFWDCVFYSLMPNFLSWLDKDLQQDYGKSFKLGFFFLLCGGTGFIVHLAVAVLVN